MDDDFWSRRRPPLQVSEPRASKMPISPAPLEPIVNLKPWFIAGGLVVAAVLISGAVLISRSRPHATPPSSPVPAAIQNAVHFPVYYPDAGKLPAGYSLDKSSFILAPQHTGVAYAVRYGKSQKLEITVQPKPSDSELQNVNSNYIPLRIDYQTPVGQAEIGAYHNQSFVSLPVTNGPWIVVTAPPNIDQAQLKQVLSALRKP